MTAVSDTAAQAAIGAAARELHLPTVRDRAARLDSAIMRTVSTWPMPWVYRRWPRGSRPRISSPGSECSGVH